ncbi:hypothetical protein [Pectobacterium brasiliense]|uniref:hypothetical protein n=1 Tax=Pectobacterium brasiliense TaxID=180957 RepID=UPI00300E6CC4
MSQIIKYIDYLRKDEIRFELDILGISTAPEETVDGLRKQLRQIHKLSRRGSIKCVLQKSPRLATELKACTPKVEELESQLTTGDPSVNTNIFRKISIRANYLIDRLARLDSDSSSLSDLRQRLIKILARVEPDHEDSSDDDSVKVDSPKCKPVARVNEEEQNTSENMGETLNEIKEPKCEKNEILVIKEKPFNLNSLNLRFNGTTCVRIFLERLEELRQAREIPHSRMLSAFSDLLEDSALAWFRSNKNNFLNYFDLIKQLKEDFDIPDLDYRLKNDIRQRTQAKHETIVSYLSTMQGMFSRLSSPMSNEEQLEILMHNIRPEYITELALNDIESIEQLKQLCKRLELARVRAEKFVEPNLNKYQPNRSKNFTYQKNQVSAVSSNYDPVVSKFCLRCKGNNHYTHQCFRSREILCYRCGKKGVKRPDCTDCNKQNLSKN